ncbi:MAG: peptide chain release factor N(5)-glutamine methyltransferase [Rhodothermaceae bacterium]
MLTVLESINLSAEYLEKKGIESARTNAEMLLADILECKRLDLYLKFDRPLNEKEKDQYREYIARRGKFEPLQYILGHVEFYGEDFDVDENVLIPRQETEILVETIIEKYSDQQNLKIMDIGTGSGIIPILLSKHLNVEKITAIDISEKAITTATKNIAKHNLSDKIELKHLNIFEINNNGLDEKYDIIVSNPPYVSETEFKTLQKEITGFEPDLAVTDFGDGYKFYKFIAENSQNYLNQNGSLFFELGKDQDEKVKGFMQSSGFDNICLTKDYLDINRVISGEKR